MSRGATLRSSALVLALSFCVATTASADPIRVTAGELYAWSDGSLTQAAFSGDGLVVVWPAFGTSTTVWVPGTEGRIDGSFTFDNPVGDPAHTLTVNGVAYLVDTLFGNLTFTSSPFIVPAPQPGVNAESFYTTVTMTGRLEGLDVSGATLFDVDLWGTGYAHAWAAVFNGSSYVLTDSYAQFNLEGPAPTPEPASLLLLGTGLAGIAIRRRSRTGAGSGPA